MAQVYDIVHNKNATGDYDALLAAEKADLDWAKDTLGVVDENPVNAVVRDTVAGFVAVLEKKESGKNIIGYVQKEEIDLHNLRTVPIPANFAGLEAEITPTRLMDQLFRIVEVIEDEDCVTITARHVWYDNLENYTLWKPTETTRYSAAAVCRNILTNAISKVNSRVASDCKDTKIGKDLDFERKNLVEAFLDPEKGVCAVFDLSLIRHNWDFYCLKEVGYDRGVVIQNGKNLLGVERKESIENLATRICPIGKDDKGEIVWLNYRGKKYIDSQYVGDYSYPRAMIYDTGLQIGKDDVTSSNINDKMLQAAQKLFRDDKVDLPEVTMTIEFLSLGDTEEYIQYRNLDKVYLYDILTIKDTIRGYNYSAQVIGVEHDILTGMLNSVTIGSISHSDGSRKIATWQVPEVNGENIRLKSIMAGSFQSGAIQTDDLGVGIITYAHIQEATINELTAGTLLAAKAQIHELIAGSITAEDIQAGSITTIALAAGAVTASTLAADAVTADKILAGAVTADKINAGAVTSDKILAGAVTAVKIASDAVTTEKLDAGAVTAAKLAAGSVTASKIDTTEIDAINATLGTATISNGYITNAYIDYARVRDITADTAIITTSIVEQGVGDRIYINRLLITYGQMVEATIGDLVIGASNGNYYHIDVEWDEYGVPSLVPTIVDTPSAAEIAAGHTTTGKTIIGDVGTYNELASENFYAINSIIDRITAKRIDVDELWARQAFINKLMVTDISSNTYIQSTIGNWQSGSTITQTINSLDSRISSLGYGTVYMQPDEPSHSELVSGDIWIQTMTDGSWQEVYDDFDDWQEIYDTVSTWQVLGSIPKMFVWDGQRWQEMYDAALPTILETEIQQLAEAITLRATKAEVNTLSGEVTEMSATLILQAEEIEAAVESVNAKAASYVQLFDPRGTHVVTLGDMWVKCDPDVMTWQDLYDHYDSWTEVYNAFDSWSSVLGSYSYVWDGTKWLETTSRAEEINLSTRIDQTDRQIALEANARIQLGNDLLNTNARLSIASNEIRAEVQRATTAEGGKLDKTSSYQTADAIVTEAVRQSGVSASGTYIAKTTSYQTADSIVTEAVRQSGVNTANGFLAKTTSYQTADAIVTEAVRQSGVNAASGYIAKTSSYQTADAIVSEAVRQAASSASGAYIAKTTNYQSADAIVSTAQKQTTLNIAPAFSTSTNYAIGDIVSYEGYVYVFTSAHSHGAWNNAHVSQTNMTSISEGGFIKKTTNYQTAEAIVQTAESYADGKASTAESNAKTYTNNNAYLLKSGITIAANGVDVTGSKHINLDVNQNTYVHIDANGITMLGKRITIDGYPIWGRDDIIVMNPNDPTSWRRTVAGIEAHMNTVHPHDWVLIKPYYDASIVYKCANGDRLDMKIDTNANSWLDQVDMGYKAFGDGEDWYNYSASLTVANSGTYRQIDLRIFLSNNPFVFTTADRVNEASRQCVASMSVRVEAGANQDTPVTVSTGNIKYNLCKESSWIYYYINGLSVDDVRMANFRLTATTDVVNGKRVSCTTYYYT